VFILVGRIEELHYAEGMDDHEALLTQFAFMIDRIRDSSASAYSFTSDFFP
jgi:hypothetical protein